MKLTLSAFIDHVHQALRDPEPGTRAGGRDRQTRTVTKRFVDACGTPYVVYTVEHRIPLTSWQRWLKRTGASVT